MYCTTSISIVLYWKLFRCKHKQCVCIIITKIVFEKHFPTK